MSATRKPGRTGVDPAIRFWAKVDRHGPSECWPWTAPLTADGYGRLRVGGRKVLAHRFSLEHSGRIIPNGMQVDHVCRNRACVNPAHLRVATQHENMQNLAGAQSRNRTGIRGVTWKPDKKLYRVTVTKQGVCHFGGYFKDVTEAAEAARQLRLSLFTHNDADRRTA